jgi:hypothetical protein
MAAIPALSDSQITVPCPVEGAPQSVGRMRPIAANGVETTVAKQRLPRG